MACGTPSIERCGLLWPILSHLSVHHFRVEAHRIPLMESLGWPIACQNRVQKWGSSSARKRYRELVDSICRGDAARPGRSRPRTVKISLQAEVIELQTCHHQNGASVVHKTSVNRGTSLLLHSMPSFLLHHVVTQRYARDDARFSSIKAGTGRRRPSTPSSTGLPKTARSTRN